MTMGQGIGAQNSNRRSAHFFPMQYITTNADNVLLLCNAVFVVIVTYPDPAAFNLPHGWIGGLILIAWLLFAKTVPSSVLFCVLRRVIRDVVVYVKAHLAQLGDGD